ncbi:MAG: NPCBM/NEW2 domain-containing protein [Fimbriimonadaceae bacterium]|nr:NPCBM/NEW2 domain-containing protein [Fimbriimonadaceae bacterium]
MFSVVLLAAMAGGEVHIEDLDLRHVTQDWGEVHRNLSVDGHPLSVAGHRYERGIGTHAVSRFVVELDGKAESFSALCGVDDEVTAPGSVTFKVVLDGKEVAATPVMSKGDQPARVTVPLKGAKKMLLLVDDGGDGIDYDHGDWLEPVVKVARGREKTVRAFVPPPEPLPEIAHGFGDKTQVHGPRVLGCTAGHDFVWRVPATGKAPLTYRAENLPAGLSLDEKTGVVRGAVATAADHKVVFVVSGPGGTDRRTVRIDSRGNLCLTPPMGWNSWNCWALAVTQDRVLDAAKSFVSTGLAAYGYQYVNIDDSWEADRGPDGIIRTNEKFPNMSYLAEQVHARGLRLGIYSSPGPKTCAGYTASYKFEKQDADTYAAWGVDYLKYDWCSYSSVAPQPDLAALQKPYRLMGGFLKASGRDIVYSLCQYGMGKVWDWGAEVGGNCWRTTGDITDTWNSMAGIGFQGDKWAAGGGPGHWNDPDMLVVGKLGWGEKLHSTKLTPHEQLTHITMWALQAAPLLIGCDLTQIDRFTLDLLTNHDVIDVDQDELGKPATRIAVDGQTEVWARPLADGSTAVGLFNRGEEPATVTAKFGDLKLTGRHRVRDLWRARDLGGFSGSYSATVPRHSAVLVKVF